jgi:dienelactone hydrolase
MQPRALPNYELEWRNAPVMKRSLGVCVVVWTCVAGLCAQTPADDPFTGLKVTAKEFVEALVKEDFTAAGREFDDVMQKAAPAEKLRDFWKSLLKQLGPFQKVDGLRGETSGKYRLVFVTCQFEKTKIDMKVVFNKDGKISGHFVVAAGSSIAYKAPAYVRPESFTETNVVIGAEPWQLPGTLTLPKGDGPFAAVVLVHGSGPHDRDEAVGPNKPFRDLAWGLASQGVAVLRYEKRTLHHSQQMAKVKDTLTIQEESIDDALAAVALLRQRKEIQGKNIFVLGHSLGAVVAPRIGMQDRAIAGLILLAGNMRPLDVVIIDQLTYIASLDGSKDQKEKIDKIKKQAARVKDVKPDTPSAELPLGVSAAYWLALRDYDQAATAAQLQQPLLILQGERDYQVTLEDFEGWKKALAKRPNVDFKSYPKLNHLFMEGEGKAKPAEYEKAGHVAREVVDDITAWIKPQAAR